MLTVADVERALPARLKTAATQGLVDKINQATTDPVVAEMIRDNFISYTGVLSEGRFKTEDYLNAVKYVSFKLLNLTNVDAYAKTFPQRYQSFLAQGLDSKAISSYVHAYNKGKLVQLIYEQTLVPTWVLNQNIHQEAINVQAELMRSADSEFVRMQAANSLLTHLAKPKAAGPLINLDMRETSGMSELKDTLSKLAQQQKELIQSGITAKAIAEQDIIEGEVVKDDLN